MSFGAIIIGDEILRGKRQDKHFAKLIEHPRRARPAARVGRVPRRRPGAHHRDARAYFHRPGRRVLVRRHRRDARRPHPAVRGVGARRRPRAASGSREAAIRGRFGGETTPLRLKMGEFPRGCGNHSERLQPDPRLLGPRPPFRARLPGDGLADGRMGARQPLSPPPPPAARGRRFDRRLRLLPRASSRPSCSRWKRGSAG